MARPRTIDPDKTLQMAMELFWRKGYDATSIQDLVDYTGVNRASLYNEFGDKHSLFLLALERYTDSVVPRRIGILTGPDAGVAAIREYFEAVVSDLLGRQGKHGCLMVNTATELAAHDAKAAGIVGRHFERLERAFEHTLRSAARRGEYGGARIKATARYLASSAQGLMVVGKARRDRRVLKDIVERTLTSLA